MDTLNTAFNFTSSTAAGDDFAEHHIRVVILDGAPWFVAADVCRALGFKHVETSMSRYVSRLGGDERRKLDKTHGLATRFPTWAVSESGLYKLIMRSDAPTAGPFQEWVTREVLPAIRRTGGYRLAGVDPEVVEEGAVAETSKSRSLRSPMQIVPISGLSLKREYHATVAVTQA